MIHRLQYLAFVVIVLVPHFAGAQSPTPPPLPGSASVLEIASVTPNSSSGRGRMGMQTDGRFTATSATLRILIREAYRVQDFQIVGEPAWGATDRFDVTVKAKPETIRRGDPVPPVQQMLRALLAERFKLKIRNETRQMPAFELTFQRPDKKTGAGMTASSVDCMALARHAGPPPPAAAGERPHCGMRIGPGRLTAGGMPISELALALSQIAGRAIIDRTGLSGGYDIDLSWTPEQFQKGKTAADVSRPPGIDPEGPSLYEAVQEQLGLKMDFGQAAVQVVIIESVEQPAK